VVAPRSLLLPPYTVLVLRYPSQGGLSVQGWVPMKAPEVLDWYETHAGDLHVALSNDDETQADFKRHRRDRRSSYFVAQTACADGSDIYFWMPGPDS